MTGSDEIITANNVGIQVISTISILTTIFKTSRFLRTIKKNKQNNFQIKHGYFENVITNLKDSNFSQKIFWFLASYSKNIGNLKKRFKCSTIYVLFSRILQSNQSFTRKNFYGKKKHSCKNNTYLCVCCIFMFRYYYSIKSVKENRLLVKITISVSRICSKSSLNFKVLVTAMEIYPFR